MLNAIQPVAHHPPVEFDKKVDKRKRSLPDGQ
jgi:hypothetical protein